VKVAGHVRRLECQRSPDLPEAPIEGAAGGQHPDHGVGLAVEQDGLIEQGRVGAEPGRPQRVRQHDDPIVSQLVFAGQKGPAVGRRNPEDIEVVRRYLAATELDRLVDAGQGDRPAALGRHVIEDLVVSLPVEEVQGRDDIRARGRSGRAPGTAAGEEHAVDEAEDGRVGADAERQDDDRHSR